MDKKQGRTQATALCTPKNQANPRTLVAAGSLTDPDRVGAQATDMANPYEIHAPNYETLRPPYATAALEHIRTALRQATAEKPRLVDIGCGHGTFLKQLCDGTVACDAVGIDPSAAMINRFDVPHAHALCAPAENIPLTSNSTDIVTCAQAWHWCDPQAASAEIGRILKAGGRFFIVFNQLNVEIPWVKRLSRIMRSGDVHHPNKPPALGATLREPHLHLYHFEHTMPAANIIELGKTRSSYLRASHAGRQHMTGNLTWYLYDHMGFKPDETVGLPYMTLVWETGAA